MNTPSLTLTAFTKPGYPERTRLNASEADLTVAFAMDFTTAGERLTKKSASDRYLSINMRDDPVVASRALYAMVRQSGARKLNIAGNGIYTLVPMGWTQECVNQYVYTVLSKVHEHLPFTHIRSGGQTGVDVAGIVAAKALGIDSLALLPMGYVQRDEQGVDKKRNPDVIRFEIEKWADALYQERYALPEEKEVKQSEKPTRRPFFDMV